MEYQSKWTHHEREMPRHIIYWYTHQLIKIISSVKKKKKEYVECWGGDRDRETRNSINNFFWHLFCLVASTDRANESKKSFWHLYFSPCSSVRQRARSCLPIPSSSLLILITHHINLKIFYQIWRWIDSLDDHDWRGGSKSAVRLL